MAHHSHVVALDGSTPESELKINLELLMDNYSENSDEAISHEWDYWVIGGRWTDEWRLKPGGRQGPLPMRPQLRAFSHTTDPEHRVTCCARLRDIEPESIGEPYSWLDLDDRWYSSWLGPELSGSMNPDDWMRGEEHMEQFLMWISKLPEDTWLIHVDYHA